MEMLPIKTDVDYQVVLQEVSALMASDPALDTPDGDRLDVLVTLVRAYEAHHFATGLPASPGAVTAACTRNGVPLLPRVQNPRPMTLALVNRLRDWP